MAELELRYEIQYLDSSWGGWRGVGTYDDHPAPRFAKLAEARAELDRMRANLPKGAHAYVRHRIYDRKQGRPV